MSEPVLRVAETDKPIAALVLQPVHGDAKDAYTVSLDEDVLSLISPDERLVMMLPREEAARHLRFNYDLFHGRTVSFVVVEGLKAHTFKCPLLELEQLLSWLPQKPREEQERDVRLYGVAFVMLGTAQLLFQQLLFWIWGLGFVLLGLANIWWPRRYMYSVNATAMFAVGLVLLFAPVPIGVTAADNAETVKLLATGLGSLLIVWSVQQASLIGPIHRLRVARAHYDAVARLGEPRPSPSVRIIAWSMFALGLIFAAHLAWLGARSSAGAAADGWPDWVITGAAAFAMFSAAIILRIRGYKSYLEAKLAAQFALVLIAFYGAGLIRMLTVEGIAFGPGILREGLLSLANIYVWAPLVAVVLLFNRWYAGRVERELEENRG